MEEAYHLFTRLPNLEFKVKHALETIDEEEKTIPYDYLIEYVKVTKSHLKITKVHFFRKSMKIKIRKNN